MINLLLKMKSNGHAVREIETTEVSPDVSYAGDSAGDIILFLNSSMTVEGDFSVGPSANDRP